MCENQLRTMHHFHLLWLITSTITFALGQTITPSPANFESQTEARLVCQTSVPSPSFSWIEGITIIFFGTTKSATAAKYDNFNVSRDGDMYTLIISDIAISDEGTYICGDGTETTDVIFTVEVKSTLSDVTINNPQRAAVEVTAQCDAVGGRPQETIEWYINDVQQTSGVAETNPSNVNPDLSNTRSVLTVTPSKNNNDQTLSCRTTGHQVASLNQRKDTTLDVQFPPDGGLTVGITTSDTSLTIDCNIALNEGNPPIDTYIISANGTIISSQRSTQYPTPTFCTDFQCTAGNELGNITADYPMNPYCPGGTTTQPPTTGNDITEETITNAPTGPSSNVGAIAGGVFGCLIGAAIIAGLVWYFCITKGTCNGKCTCCSGGSKVPSGSGSGKKNNENKVSGTTSYRMEAEVQPVAAPRTSVKYDTDNPEGAQYAMVDKRGQGEPDYPDAGRNGRGKNESQLTYADIDLSQRAGHSDRHVPKDEGNVVVYSSIVV